MAEVALGKVLLITLDAVAVAVLVVAIAFPVRQGPGPRPIQQRGAFRYEGVAPSGDVYPEGKFSTGDAVFTRLATAVTVHFDYSTDAAQGAVHGTVGLDLELSNRTGWRVRRQILAPTTLTDDAVVLHADLDLGSIQELADRVAAESGISGSGIDIVLHAVARMSSTESAPTPNDSVTDFSLALQLSPVELSLDLTAVPGTVVADTPAGPAVIVVHALELPAGAAISTGLFTDGMRRVAFFGLLGAIALTFSV